MPPLLEAFWVMMGPSTDVMVNVGVWALGFGVAGFVAAPFLLALSRKRY